MHNGLWRDIFIFFHFFCCGQSDCVFLGLKDWREGLLVWRTAANAWPRKVYSWQSLESESTWPADVLIEGIAISSEKSGVVQSLRSSFWLDEPVNSLACPALEDVLVAVVSSHALSTFRTSTELNTTLDKCSIYSAPFSTCKLYKSFNYNQNICHPELICWLIIACKSFSLCPGLCSFLIPLCLNRSAILNAFADSCVLKCLGLESKKIMIVLHFTGGQLGQR